MKPVFADAARELAGVVPRLLGWKPGDFWDATPAELAAIMSATGEPASQTLKRTELEQMMEEDNHG